MPYHEFFVAATGSLPLGIRPGQHAFNVLHAMRPDLADRVRGTSLDPFYRDERLDAFFEWVASNW